MLRVPNLCIHLNRGVNDGFGPNKETEMVPVLAQQATYELNKPAEVKNEIGDGTSIKGKDRFLNNSHSSQISRDKGGGAHYWSKICLNETKLGHRTAGKSLLVRN